MNFNGKIQLAFHLAVSIKKYLWIPKNLELYPAYHTKQPILRYLVQTPPCRLFQQVVAYWVPCSAT